MSFPIAIVAAALLGLGQPAQGRSCPPATAPARLPDVAAVVDVEALRAALAPVFAETPAAGDMIFSVRFRKDGQSEWIRAVGDDADEGIRPAVGRLIASHLRSPGASPEPWSVRLKVIPADTVQFQVSRSEVCPVEPIELRIVGLQGSLMQGSDMAELRRATPYTVRVDVSATGTIVGVDLVRRSGSRIVDDMAIETANASKFRPALVDGIPVAGRFEFSSRTRVRSGARL